MCFLYNDEYLNKLKNKCRIHLLIPIAIMLIMIIANTVLIVFFADIPYGLNLKNVFIIISCVITVILTFVACFYFEIFYAPVRKYYKKLIKILISKKDTSLVTVLKFDDSVSSKDGVEFNSINVLEWSDTKNDYVERTVFCDSNFKISVYENQMINVITCGNILLGYEVK